MKIADQIKRVEAFSHLVGSEEFREGARELYRLMGRFSDLRTMDEPTEEEVLGRQYACQILDTWLGTIFTAPDLLLELKKSALESDEDDLIKYV